nr:integrase, catalytic region, zinc finger, CCHC-type, peptidase aspartic, catalytic [Tanacetum cinerariifolium]
MMKESHSKEAKTTKIVKAKENALDAEIQIISSKNFQNHQETKTKGLLLEDPGAIAVKMRKTKVKTKLVSWLKHQMSRRPATCCRRSPPHRRRPKKFSGEIFRRTPKFSPSPDLFNPSPPTPPLPRLYSRHHHGSLTPLPPPPTLPHCPLPTCTTNTNSAATSAATMQRHQPPPHCHASPSTSLPPPPTPATAAAFQPWRAVDGRLATVAAGCPPPNHHRGGGRTTVQPPQPHLVEQVKNEVVELYFVRIEDQLVDIFNKPLAREQLEFFINKLGMRSMSPETLKKMADEEEESCETCKSCEICLGVSMRNMTRIMNPQEIQQVTAHDEKWVPSTERVKISPTNKCIVDVEVFRKILDICLRMEGEEFTEVQDGDATLTFLIDLGYKGPLHKYTNIGKGSQGKKTADTPMIDVDVFGDSGSEPAKKRTASRRVVKKRVIIFAADNIIPDPYVALELDQGDDEEVDWIDSDEDEEKKYDTDDDKSIDLEMIDGEETEDEFVQGEEQVNHNENEEMLHAKVEESRNGDEENTEAAKADVEKTKEVKADAKKAELLSTSSSLSVSSGFVVPVITLAPSSVSTVPPVPHKTTTPTPTPPITTIAPTITIAVLESDALTVVQLRVAKLEKDVFELKKIDYSIKALDTLQHTADLIQEYYVKPTLKSSKIHKPTIDLEQESEKISSEIRKIKRNHANHAFYHALMEALIEDENAMDKGVANTVKNHKRKHDDDNDDDDDKDPSTKPNQGKSTSAKEPVEEPIAKVVMDDTLNTVGEDVVRDDDEPQDTSEPKTYKTPNQDWFRQPLRPPTSDLEWNKRQVVLYQPVQPWFNQMVSAINDHFTFNDLIGTLIDFSKYVLNRLKIDKLTQDLLLGPAYNLLKGTSTSSIKLEYNFQECFNALTDKLDWNNPKEDQVVVKRADRQLYKFKEGDFVDLQLNNIEDMLLLVVHHKLFHFNDIDIVEFIVSLQHQNDTKVFTMTMEILPKPTSNKLCDRMEDPNIRMEEYIRLEEEKAQKCDKVFYCETAKYGKI